MKILAAFILSLSLMATSSFAVSLNAPLVLKMQEDHTMAASDFTTEETPEFDWGPIKFIVGVYSWLLALGGFAFMVVGLGELDKENINAGAMIGGGAGMMGLGALGLYWVF